MAKRCGTCETTFKRADVSCECCACKKRFHQACTELSDDETKLLNSKSILKWYCNICDPDVSDILANYQKFKKVSNEISKLKDENEKRWKEFERRLILCESNKNTGDVQEAVQKELDRKIEVEKEEEKLVESKKNNLIYFRLPESESDSTEERIKSDFQLLKSAHDENIIKPDQIKTIFRVGKKKDGEARPLVVRFKAYEDKQRVLKQTGDLKVRWQNEVIDVYASIDRTEEQRKEHKELVRKLKARKEAGEMNLVIRDDKIIENFRTANASQRVTFASLFRN